jgi:hypothetical protein
MIDAAVVGQQSGSLRGQRYWQWPEELDDKLLKVMEDMLQSSWAADAQFSWLVSCCCVSCCAVGGIDVL